MTQEKIVEIVKKVDEFIDTMIGIQNNYINKINGYLDSIENLITNAIQHSEEFIKRNLKKLLKKIDDALKGFKNKITTIIDQLNNWYDDVVNCIKTQIVLFTSAKLGIPITKAAAKSAAESMPHPALGLPTFEIILNLPNLEEMVNMDTVTVINIPRIPTISR